jgi:hypothetical protein
MLKISSPAILLTCIAVFLGALSTNLAASATEFDRSIVNPQVTKAGPNDDGIKPVLPKIHRSSGTDDSIKPRLPKVKQFSGTDDSVRPILPKNQQFSGTDDSI